MPIDPSIPLQYTPIQPMQTLSSLLSNQKQMQEVKQGDINLKERKYLQGFLSNPSNYTGEDGSIDMVKARSLLQGAPTTGMDVLNHMANTQQAITTSQREISSQTDENRSRIASVIAAMPDGVTPEQFGKTLDVIGQQYKGMDTSIALAKKHYGEVFGSNPKAADKFRQEMAREVLPQPTQQAMNTGTVIPVSTSGGTQLVQTAQGAAQPQGSNIGQPLTSPNQITSTPTGGIALVNPSTGSAKNLNGDSTPPLTNFPAGETNETMKVLQDQRTSAQTVANQAPVLHDINREVKATLAKGITTGQLGGTIAKLKSTLGIGSEAAEQGASDYDILGKMLERSALTAAQGMGPQTNAGLEAQIKANGSQAYNPTALKKIANLNDALVTGSEKYQGGLERAIESSPNGVFVKRKFDQHWAANADPMALRLLNAAKNGDKEEISDIFNTVGGPKSKQGQALRQKLMNLKSLSETGQLQ